MRRQSKRQPTQKMLRAMSAALNAALAGDGFDGGDFNGENSTDFEAALAWVRSRQTGESPPEPEDAPAQVEDARMQAAIAELEAEVASGAAARRLAAITEARRLAYITKK